MSSQTACNLLNTKQDFNIWKTEGNVVHLVYKPFATRTGTKTEYTYVSVLLFTAELNEIGTKRERVFFF